MDLYFCIVFPKADCDWVEEEDAPTLFFPVAVFCFWEFLLLLFVEVLREERDAVLPPLLRGLFLDAPPRILTRNVIEVVDEDDGNDSNISSSCVNFNDCCEFKPKVDCMEREAEGLAALVSCVKEEAIMIAVTVKTPPQHDLVFLSST